MRIRPVVATALTIGLLCNGPALSQGMVHGVKHSATTKARCSPGDPNVLMDVKTKTYVMDTSKVRSTMMHDRTMSSMKSLCKSEAESMGGHLARGMRKTL